ncbi:uncharacterized protein LOC126798091 isoform X2 [Argentina anserina]|uniref:uncharacterized protein LOC126798091 isoform X2 n=1 Tax=Argentina anserina TaxID=57926 RepID=UPI0021767543|nr:uncharacterized protein LOC126798091 isoform X2 [Potentilla anserina]
MPGNEFEGRIHNLYELENYTRQSQVADGNWPGLIYNQWQEKQREITGPLNFSLKNNIQQLDSERRNGNGSLNVSFNQDYSHLTQRPGLSNLQPGHQYLKTNEYMLGRDIFQASQNQVQFLGETTGFVPQNLASHSLSILNSEQDYASGDSPTLTTNSERSEVTEASTEINFIGRQQQFSRGQQGISPHHSMHQSGYNEMQLLQQHLVFKQLQELQRQQQVQQFGDSRQHNSVNQLSAVAKQAAGVQFSPLINGTPVNDTPQMLMNWVQRGASPTGQNVSNRVSFSPEQGQTLQSMGQAPQQFDVSLYGTPISSGRGTMSQYPHLQSMSQDSVNLLTKANQVQKPAVQASAFSNSFLGDHCTTPDQVFLPQGAFISKQGFQGKNMFGQATVPGLNCGSTLGSLQQENALQTEASLRGLNGKQERDGWPDTSQSNTMQHGPSQGLVPLDPMEEKILFNTDDSLWDPSLVNCNDISGGGLGSWSALMQSAVADSSSDTGLHEEWSGLSFQNTELSSGNQPSNILDSEKQQGNWAVNNLHSASSYSSKPSPMLNDSSVSSSFPGFQQPGIQYKSEHRESLHQDESHESIQKSPRSNSEWLDHNSRQQVQQSLGHLDNTWVSQRNELSECDAPRQRIDQYAITHPSNKPEGDNNGAMYKRNSDGSLWKMDGDTRVTSFSRSAGQLEQLQSSSDDTLRSRQNPHMFNFPSVPNAHISKTHQESSQQVRDNSKLDYVQRMVSGNKDEDAGLGERQRQMSNSNPIIQNSHWRDEKTYEQQSCFQNDNSYDCKPVDTSARVGRSVGPSGVHLTAATSQNMLELLNKVDRLKENSSGAQFDPSGFNPLSEMTDAKYPVASINQMYNQSSASQGFALKLAPPSQLQSNLNAQFSPQGLLQPARQMDSDLGEKNQAYLATSPPSSQSLSRSHESSPRGRWDDKLSIGGQPSISQSYMHGGSIAEITSSPTFLRNQLPTQVLFNPHASGPSTQATLPATATGHPHSDLAQSENSSQQTFVNPDGQQFPILESVPVSHPAFSSGMPPQGGVSFRPHNLWTNKASMQHVSGMEPQKASTVVFSNDSMETTPLTLKELNSLNSQQGGGPLQGFTSPEEKHAKERSQKAMFTGMLEASQVGVRNVSNPGALPSGSMLANSNLQDPDRIRTGDNNGLSPTVRNLQLIGHALNPSHGFGQNYSLLQQVQAMKNMVTVPSGRDLDAQQATIMAGQQSVYDHNKDGELSTASHLKSLPHGNTNVPSFLSEAREDPSMKGSPQSALQAQGMVAFGETDSQSQCAGSNGTPIHAEASRANLYMAANWFKQYGNLRNGQGPLMQDARTAVGKFSYFKPSQSLNTHVDQIEASDVNQSSKVWPGTAANIVPNEPLIAPCGLISNASNQSTDIVRPKKRKIAICDQPWHKVAQGSKEVQDFSLSEEDWALASNRLVEKVPDEFGMIEDVPPMFRAKRRLIFTTQFMQHLLGPAPASLLSANAALHYDSVTYFVAMLAIGDACSLTCSKRNSTLKQLDSSNMILDKPKVSEKDDDQFFSKIVGDLTDRSKKLENELLRLDRAASILDVRLECQELERFSVINRFAKFHLPRADMSGTSSASGTSRPCPQRYVTGQPLPKNLPEGVQCLSL